MVIYIQTGKSNSQDSVDNGKYPLFDRSSKIKKSNNYIFDGEYTIVPGEGIFKPKYYNGKFDLHQRAYVLHSNKVKGKYLFFYILKNWKNFYSYSVGSTVPSLRLSSFSWIQKHKFPSIKTQKEIIDIIEPIEIFIEKINLIKEKWLNLMKNQYKISNKKILKIKKIGNVFIGGTPSTKNSKFWNGNIDWINSGSLTNNFISKNINKKITNNAVKKSYKVKNNSLLFSIIDPSKNKISISRSELCINQSIATIISKKILYFEIKDIMWFFNKIKSGSAQQSINKNDILKTKIKLSNIDFSNNFIKLKKIILLQEKLILSKNKILKLLIK